MFWKKDVKENVKSTYNERLLEVETELIKLKTHLKALEMENDDLRNKVLRKIQKKQQIDEINDSNSYAIGGSVKGVKRWA